MLFHMRVIFVVLCLMILDRKVNMYNKQLILGLYICSLTHFITYYYFGFLKLVSLLYVIVYIQCVVCKMSLIKNTCFFRKMYIESLRTS